MENCSFCNLENASDIEVLYSNELVFYCQNVRHQGSLKYSGNIVPINHRETVFDLTEEERNATFKLLRKVKDSIEQKYSPDGYNVGWNCYEIGGQILPFHAHMHVMPRFKQEPLAGKGIRYFLKSDMNKW